ncbi:hypothetical protein Pelo_6514 [Pelomyxa schiedti]|nr:hypothetical protein Pelo_6514 [Pelomyxa schiedti]
MPGCRIWSFYILALFTLGSCGQDSPFEAWCTVDHPDGTSFDHAYPVTLGFYGQSRTKDTSSLIHEEIVTSLYTAYPRPSAVFHAGGMVEGDGSSSWQSFFQMISPLCSAIPMYFVHGGESTDAFTFNTKSSPTYWVQFGGVRVTVLDTTEVNADQTAFLTGVLSNTTGVDWDIAMLYKPRFSTSHGGCGFLDSDFEKALSDADLVIQGRDANYERAFPMLGPHWISTGGAAPVDDLEYQFWTNTWSASFKTVNHFLTLQATATSLTVKAINPLNGTIVYDTLSVIKGQPFNWYGRHGDYDVYCQSGSWWHVPVGIAVVVGLSVGFILCPIAATLFCRKIKSV